MLTLTKKSENVKRTGDYLARRVKVREGIFAYHLVCCYEECAHEDSQTVYVVRVEHHKQN